MKTTLYIADALLEEIRAVARKERRSMRSVIEEALRLLFQKRRQEHSKQKFTLKRASFRGKGLNPKLRSGSWSDIADLIYEDQGA